MGAWGLRKPGRGAAHLALNGSERVRLYGCLLASGDGSSDALSSDYCTFASDGWVDRPQQLGLGRIPAGRERLNLMARDAGGNSTVIRRKIQLPTG